MHGQKNIKLHHLVENIFDTILSQLNPVCSITKINRVVIPPSSPRP